MYISVDPGENNGIAIHNGAMLIALQTQSSLQVIKTYLYLMHSGVVVLESSPSLVMYDLLLEYGVRSTQLDIQTYQPARWKPYARAQRWKVPIAETQHEKDAYNMLRFYFLANSDHKHDIGEPTTCLI